MRTILATLSEKIAAEHSAIVVVDMQNDFCAEGGYINEVRHKDVSHASELATRITCLVDTGRDKGVLIIWVRAVYDPCFLVSPMLAKQQENGVGEQTLCTEGSWGAEFFGVQPCAGEYVIDKHRYSAFSGTKLDNLLRDNGINTLIMTGVATNVCVESTLRDGFMHGYYIVVPEDCVGSHNHDLHDATLTNVRLTFGDVTTSAELMSIWTGH